ncbi:MAG: non-homologous end-joining DNA ligase [Actinomycetota bacterium]|nr:non-homologous end-joining DNA ligase [Actinomycetota bacterium]
MPSKRSVKQPSWVTPMLATLSERRDFDRGWIFERKFDGIRALAFKQGSAVELLSRNKLDLRAQFAAVLPSIETQRNDFILDGEVVAMSRARSSFELLQQRGARTRLVYQVFDIMFIDGEDVTARPFVERKRSLSALTETPALKVSRALRGSAERLLETACARGWEGVIAKRADAPYTPGRSRDWLKLKCSLEQEFVAGGFSDPKGSRSGFGALLLGVYGDGGLRYAGEVGTGFSHDLLRALRARLDAIERATSPFVDFAKPRKGVHWVEPSIVVQVGFSEWTRDGRLRHPRFLGERTDKSPRDVLRERPS